ncbi:MAG: DUF86 domain-containing protein [Planctomycetia bacterium]|nr:DUF86 domain-containing protein [Planctomycetia bacterium]
MVDKPLILRKLTELDEYLKQVGEFSSVTLEEYSRDWKVRRIVERTLQMMIETCADIANHIMSCWLYFLEVVYKVKMCLKWQGIF